MPLGRDHIFSSDGNSYKEIIEIIGERRVCLTKWRKNSIKDRMEGLRDKYRSGKTKAMKN